VAKTTGESSANPHKQRVFKKKSYQNNGFCDIVKHNILCYNIFKAYFGKSGGRRSKLHVHSETSCFYFTVKAGVFVSPAKIL